MEPNDYQTIRIKQVEGQLQKSDRTIETLKAQLEEKDRVIAHVENQIDGVSDELARHDRTIADKANQIANLIEKNENQMDTIKRLQAEATSRIRRHNQEVDDFEQRIVGHVSTISAYEGEIGRLDAEVAELRKEIQQAEQWKNGVDSLNRMLHQAEGLNRQRLAIIEDRTNEIANLKERLNDQYSTWERERQLKVAYTAAIQKAMSDFGIKFGWVDDEELTFLEAAADGVEAHVSDLKSELDNIRTGR